MAADILEGLNQAQLEAVTSTEGFVRVIAGAGSGKTRALTHRFAYLVEDMGILPSNILCVTFTNKAANEMRQRIHNLTGDNDTGYINTFHGFCVSVLQEDIYAIGYPKHFLVLDNSDIDAILRQVYEERQLTMRDMTFSHARDMIEMQKLFINPDYYLDLISLSLDELRRKYDTAADVRDIIFFGYLYQQKKCFALDYNDLIKFSLYIFREKPEIRAKWQQRLAYIMIDEFQDIDRLQYELMEVLCAYHKNLFIVGDPDQTIYTWRGASVKFLLDFDRQFTPCHTILMTENYRSTPEILNCANSLIEKNSFRIEKSLLAMQPHGPKAACHFAESSEAEALWIADRVHALHGEGVPFRDMTVLYRAHYVTRSIEDAFMKEQVPFTICSGISFFEREEIKDALSYLRMIAYRDDLSFRRICNKPKRNLGERRIRFLEEKAEADGCSLYRALGQYEEDPIFKGTKATAFMDMIEKMAERQEKLQVSEVLSEILNRSGYTAMLRTEGSQERLDNLAELTQSIHDYEISCGEECTLEHYLTHIALYTGTDLPENSDKVKLMTIHAAKGLEFPHVFLCGMNEGIFPTRKADTRQAMEEERRLAFVAITRAEKTLAITESGGRTFDNSPRYPSRFILDIGQDFLAYDAEPAEGLIREARQYIEAHTELLPDGTAPDLLPIRARVKHRIMGLGSVIEYDMKKGAYLIQFDGMETPRAISFKAKVLEKVPWTDA